MIRQARLAIASALATLSLSGLPAATEQTPSLTLVVQHPDGHEMRLEYRPGNGWRSLAQRDGAMSAAYAPHRADQPLSVFVDGPTGYVFVWDADAAAWTFVGQLAESAR